jgi:hypothetical protein
MATLAKIVLFCNKFFGKFTGFIIGEIFAFCSRMAAASIPVLCFIKGSTLPIVSMFSLEKLRIFKT